MSFSPCAQRAIDEASGGSCDDLLKALIKSGEGSAVTALREAGIRPMEALVNLGLLSGLRRGHDYPSAKDIGKTAKNNAKARGFDDTLSVDLIEAILASPIPTAAEQVLTELGLNLDLLRRIQRKIRTTKYRSNEPTKKKAALL
ncbi:MAG: hypothetical protein NVSMB39_4160 [Candidatus Saccharimonadales bacterium]